MGIYPTTKYESMEDGTFRRTVREPGLTTILIMVPVLEIVERDNCYCCSCGDLAGSDPYCRNHGWAGERPCKVHGMPGQEDDEDDMPDSVQIQNLRHELRYQLERGEIVHHGYMAALDLLKELPDLGEQK